MPPAVATGNGMFVLELGRARGSLCFGAQPPSVSPPVLLWRTGLWCQAPRAAQALAHAVTT